MLPNADYPHVPWLHSWAVLTSSRHLLLSARCHLSTTTAQEKRSTSTGQLKSNFATAGQLCAALRFAARVVDMLCTCSASAERLRVVLLSGTISPRVRSCLPFGQATACPLPLRHAAMISLQSACQHVTALGLRSAGPRRKGCNAVVNVARRRPEGAHCRAKESNSYDVVVVHVSPVQCVEDKRRREHRRSSHALTLQSHLATPVPITALPGHCTARLCNTSVGTAQQRAHDVRRAMRHRPTFCVIATSQSPPPAAHLEPQQSVQCRLV